MVGPNGATLGLLIHYMRGAKVELAACTLLSLAKLGDFLYLGDTQYKFMKRTFGNLAALLHLAHRHTLLPTHEELLVHKHSFLSVVLALELHMKFLQQLMLYNDKRGGATFATWKREYLVGSLFWWAFF